MKKGPHNFWSKIEYSVHSGLQEKKLTSFAFSLYPPLESSICRLAAQWEIT